MAVDKQEFTVYVHTYDDDMCMYICIYIRMYECTRVLYYTVHFIK